MESQDKFCPSCAAKLHLRKVSGTERPMCPRCRRVIYYDPKVAAISVVERGEEILLIRRGNQPGYGLWSMPGGYVDRGEVVERAAIREVMEETGLEVEIEQLIGLFSEPGRPVMVAAFAMREIGGLLGPGEEALDVGFFPRHRLPAMAFPGDLLILDRWQSLRNSP